MPLPVPARAMWFGEQPGRMKPRIDNIDWLPPTLHKLWLIYFSTFTAFVSVAVHIAIIPQFFNHDTFEKAQHLWPAFIRLVVYPCQVGVVALMGQVLRDAMVSAIEERPLSELRLGLLAVFGMGSEKLGTVNKGIAVFHYCCMALGFFHGSQVLADGVPSGILIGFLHASTCVCATEALARIAVEARLAWSLKAYESFEALNSDLGVTMTVRRLDGPDGSAGAYGLLDPREEANRRKVIAGVKVLVALSVVQSLVALATTKWLIPDWSLDIFMTLCFLCSGIALSWIFSRVVVRHSWVTCVSWFWLVLGVYIFVATAGQILPGIIGNMQGPRRLSRAMFSPPPDGTRYDLHHESHSQALGFGSYPVCKMLWNPKVESVPEKLSVLDLTAFAQAVYFGSEEDIMAEVRNSTAGTDLGAVRLEYISSWHEVGRLGVFDLPAIRTRVASVRGSSQAADWRMNFDIWAPSALWGLVMSFMPFSGVVPAEYARNILSFDLRRYLLVDPPWTSILEEVTEFHAKSLAEGYNLVLTGHSLGGGIAQGIGASLGVPTIVFSPVGLSLSMARVGLNEMGDLPVENNVISVIPWGDAVPLLLDTNTGLVQHIQCKTKGVASCHSLTQTACELYRKCGDPRGRDMAAICTTELGKDWHTVPWTTFSWRS